MKFKVGDKVTVVKTKDSCNWARIFKEMIGKKYTIVEISPKGGRYILNNFEDARTDWKEEELKYIGKKTLREIEINE